MKTCLKLAVLIAVCLILSSCATSHVATKIGQNIGESYEKSATLGKVSGKKIYDNWPYISGLIKGIAGADYEREVPQIIQEVVDELDTICVAEKEPTLESEGKLIGLTVRLEYLGGKFYWEKYGVSLTKWFKVFLLGG